MTEYRREGGCPRTTTNGNFQLRKLPDTAIHTVFQHLSVHDQLALARSCRRMHALHDSVARANNTVINISELCSTGRSTNKLCREMTAVFLGGGRSKLRIYFKCIRALHHKVTKVVADTTQYRIMPYRECTPRPRIGFGVLLLIAGWGATLKELNLKYCYQLKEPKEHGFGIFQLAKFLPVLERINLSGCTLLNDRSLEGLNQCPKLTHVAFDQMDISEDGLALFSKHHPKLVSASLAAIALTNDGLTCFSKNCAHLECIDISDNDAGYVNGEECINGTSIVDLVQRCPALTSITFTTYDHTSPEDVLSLVASTTRKHETVELIECCRAIDTGTLSFKTDHKR